MATRHDAVAHRRPEGRPAVARCYFCRHGNICSDEQPCTACKRQFLLLHAIRQPDISGDVFLSAGATKGEITQNIVELLPNEKSHRDVMNKNVGK